MGLVRQLDNKNLPLARSDGNYTPYVTETDKEQTKNQDVGYAVLVHA
jgi:hypothetical protein